MNDEIEISMHGDARRRPRGPLTGHSHVPWRPSRLRVLYWRMFRWAKYRAHVRPVQLGCSTPLTLDYNTGPAKWRQQHLTIVANGTVTTHDVKGSK